MKKKVANDKGGDAASKSALAAAVKASAQEIWLAGLGAFAKAQEEGGKAFDTLVVHGKAMQKRSRSSARMRGDAGDTVATTVERVTHDLSQQVSQSWDRLEQVFEKRVAQALSRLGVPTAAEVDALVAQVDQLNATVRRLSGQVPRQLATASQDTSVTSEPRVARKTAVRPSASKTAARKAAAATTPTTSPRPRRTLPAAAPRKAAGAARRTARASKA
jgi:poly(hydroxyalkanoate) granule-associated protein